MRVKRRRNLTQHIRGEGNIEKGMQMSLVSTIEAARVAHQFFDLVTIFRNGERFADAPNTQIRLRDANLAQWTACESQKI